MINETRLDAILQHALRGDSAWERTDRGRVREAIRRARVQAVARELRLLGRADLAHALEHGASQRLRHDVPPAA